MYTIYLCILWFSSPAFCHFQVHRMENCAVFTVYLSISFSWSSWKQCGIFHFISCILLVNIEIPLSFVCWSCILWHCWIPLILRDFGRFPGIFYAKNNLICKYRQFYISFPNLKMSFISFFFCFCLPAVAWTSSTILHKSGE